MTRQSNVYAATDRVKDRAKEVSCTWTDEEGWHSVTISLQLIEPSVLLRKKLFLIDTFDTVVSARHLYPDLSPSDFFKIREGIVQFLEHYRANGVRIGLHTDSVPCTTIRRAAQQWGIGQYLEGYFGEESLLTTHPATGKFLGFKDFRRMAKEMNCCLEDALVIGDGGSTEKQSAIYAGVDLLLVQPYEHEIKQQAPKFSFASLIYGKQQ